MNILDHIEQSILEFDDTGRFARVVRIPKWRQVEVEQAAEEWNIGRDDDGKVYDFCQARIEYWGNNYIEIGA